MVSGFGDLNGSGPQQIWMENRRVSQNQEGNYSTFYGEIRYYGNGFGSWTNNACYWAGNFNGQQVGGSFTIPESQRYASYITLWAGYYNVAHDPAGNLGIFPVSASIDTPHASIGDGSVGLTEPPSPRIPKRPSPPPFSIDSETADSFRVVVQASADNGGSSVSSYLVRVSSNPQADTPGTYEDYPGSGTRTITGRNPATRYYVTVYAKNGSADNNGYSNYQASKVADTLAGVYVSTGSSWVPQGARESDGSTWDASRVQYSDGAAWLDPSI